MKMETLGLASLLTYLRLSSLICEMGTSRLSPTDIPQILNDDVTSENFPQKHLCKLNCVFANPVCSQYLTPSSPYKSITHRFPNILLVTCFGQEVGMDCNSIPGAQALSRKGF